MNLHTTTSRYSIVALSLTIVILSCSPIPLIQSPRVDSQFSFSSSIKNSGVAGVNSADERIRKKDSFVVDETIPVFFSVGIRNRVELSGIVFPYFLYGLLWQGAAKVNLFDIGKGNFHNLASALFLGSSGYFGEHEDKACFHGGISVGSTVKTGIGAFEIVAQSSVSNEREHSFESDDRYAINWLQPALGIIYQPTWLRILYLNIGVNYSHPLSSDVYYTRYIQPIDNPVDRLTNTARGGFTVLAELKCVVIR